MKINIPFLIFSLIFLFPRVSFAADAPTGNVIFIHPDGAGLNAWNAYRMYSKGPDETIAWDRLPKIGLYRGHMKDSLTATSHGGATTHAYGVKVPANSYGMHGNRELKALSGFKGSIMEEALAAGKAAGIVNSGHIGEPGTGVFLASVKRRRDVQRIAKEILLSDAQVIMSGGEEHFLPEGEEGFHGFGIRKDGANLIKYAKSKGFTIVYTKDQLASLDLSKVEKLLGIFSEDHTFFDYTEERLDASKLPLYDPQAPTLGQMMDAALKILSRDPDGFFLVAEEEGSDNFGNKNNASGVLEALARADAGYTVALEFLEAHPDTLIITAADSDAGGLQIYSPSYPFFQKIKKNDVLDDEMANGAPLDGREGSHSRPFVSGGDKNGKRYYFGVTFAGYSDVHGAIVARAAGLNSERLPLNVDNTDIYRMMYLTLFGKDLGLTR